MQFLQLFWGMAKHIQDEFLRATVSVKGESKKEWFMLGKRMGPKCVLAILGVGNARMARVEQGRLDRRFSVWGGVSCQGNSLLYLYNLFFVQLRLVVN